MHLFGSKRAILNKEVIRNCNGLGLWNKIKSNKKRPHAFMMLKWKANAHILLLVI